MVLTKTAMNELRTHLSFTQLRFHCSKNNGRTFHVTTAANSTGEAVVQYFSGQTNDQPASCGSYVRMENDNSRLAGVCQSGDMNAADLRYLNGAMDLIDRYYTTTLLLFWMHIIGRLITVGDGNAMICVLT